jgi:hypothetical protein
MKKVFKGVFIFLFILSGCGKKEGAEKLVFEKVGEISTTDTIYAINNEEPYLLISDSTYYYLEDDEVERLPESPRYFSMTTFTEEKGLIAVSGKTSGDTMFPERPLVMNYFDENYEISEVVIADESDTNIVFSFDRKTGEIKSYTCELKYCGYYSFQSQDGYNWYSYIEYSDAEVQVLFQWNDEDDTIAFLFDVDEMKIVGNRYSNIYKVSDWYGNDPSWQKEIFIVEKDGRYGIVDQNGVEKVPLIYKSLGRWAVLGDRIFATKEYIIAMNSAGKYGVINWENEILIDFQYDHIAWVLDNGDKFVVSKKGNYGVVNRNGDIIVDFLYDLVVGSAGWSTDFVGYYAAEKDGKVGILDQNGEVLVPITYNIVDDGFPYDYFPLDAIPYSWETSKVGPYLAIMIDLYSYDRIYINKDGVIDDIEKFKRPEKINLDYEGYYVEYKDNKYYIKNENGKDVYGKPLDSVELNDSYIANKLNESGNVKGRYVEVKDLQGKRALFDLEQEKIVLSGSEISYFSVEETFYFYEVNDGKIKIYDSELDYVLSVEGGSIRRISGNYYQIKIGEKSYIYKITQREDK